MFPKYGKNVPHVSEIYVLQILPFQKFKSYRQFQSCITKCQSLNGANSASKRVLEKRFRKKENSSKSNPQEYEIGGQSDTGINLTPVPI